MLERKNSKISSQIEGSPLKNLNEANNLVELRSKGVFPDSGYQFNQSEENIKSNYNNEERIFNKAHPSPQLKSNLSKNKKISSSNLRESQNSVKQYVINNNNYNINNNINIIASGEGVKSLSDLNNIILKDKNFISENFENQVSGMSNLPQCNSSKKTKVFNIQLVKPIEELSSTSLAKQGSVPKKSTKSNMDAFSSSDDDSVNSPPLRKDSQTRAKKKTRSISYISGNNTNNIASEVFNNRIHDDGGVGYLSVFQQLTLELTEKPSRYTKANIDLGKNYFKNRFILEKMVEVNNNSSLQHQFQHRVSVDNVKRSSMYLPENKNLIKFSSTFLQKIEKGIFSFNLKKYEESFRFLLESNIIKNEEEFGELLLVVHGWDKYIVGEFLSKDNKPPNTGLKILKHFMKKLDFRKIKFTEAMRLMLSRLNLPKDSALILNIIDAFAETFFNDNKETYSDLDSVYLLSCTVLTLNTSFHKNIPNLQGFKKHEFIKMNKNISPQLLDEIYEEIKDKKLDIVYEYNELIYRRLYAEGLNQNLESHPKYENHNKNELKSDEIINILKAGQTFIKYGNYGDPHIRFVRLSDDEKRLTWEAISSCSIFNRTKSLETLNLKDVYIGYSNSKIFEKYKIPPEFDACCFSIVSSTRTLDLRNDDESICRKWYQAIKFLIKRTKSISEFQNNKNNLKEIINKKEVIVDIWKTEILPNWHNYRKFILLKENRVDFAVEKKRKNVKFSKILFQNLKDKTADENRFKLIDEKNKSDVIYLWMLGIPDFLRKKLWPLVIGNDLRITENLFQYYLKQIEQVDLSSHEETIFKSTGGNINTFGNENNNSSNQIGYEFNSNLRLNHTPYDNPVVNVIIFDVHKVCKKFFHVIAELGIDEKKLKSDLFKIVRVFTLSRTDITYCKQITYIALIFLLNCENFYSAYECLINFTIPSYLSKLLLNDESYIKLRYEFFDQLFKNYIPILHNHFKNLDVSLSLFFFNWVEFLFINFFDYNMLLRIWDSYIIKGEIFVYEVALTILKIQEKELINLPVKDILKNLKKMQMTIMEDDFFDLLQEIDISEDYKLIIGMNNLAFEKTLLYESLL